MTTLQKQKGKYWYIVESKRVDGKPRPVPVAYLGKAEDILEKLEGKKPVSSKSFEFGTVAIIDHFINKLGIIDLFNSIAFPNGARVPKRNGLDFGQTMAMIIIHRAVSPSSKRSFSQWAVRTFLPQMYKFDHIKITSQHFWDMMDLLSIEQLRQIERELSIRIIREYDIKLDLLLYDYTNFFTYIDTNNKRNTIAQRGKNKQKRNDLRQFCLALLVARGHRIPLFSDVYEGNKSDSNEFSDSIDILQQRVLDTAGSIEDITIVFDKGSNSKENFKQIGELNYVASFSVEHDKDLKELPYKDFYDLELEAEDKDLDDGPKIVKCLRKTKKIWGEDRTVVLYKSEALFDGQLVGLKADLKKTKTALAKLKNSGQRGYYLKKGNQQAPWTYELFEKQIEQTVNKRFVRDVMDFNVKRMKNNRFDLTFKINRKRYEHIKKTVLGKRILITSRHEWDDAEIIAAYHGQSDVERAFRQIKNPFHTSVRPQYHWTDQKICVHTFCSLLSLTISSLVEMIARKNGFELSIDEILHRLSDLRKAKYVYRGPGKKGYEIEYKLEEEEDPINIKLYQLLTK
jgi:transposase